MKKMLCFMLALLLTLCVLPGATAFAWTYTQRQSNAATFETFEEARVNGPAYLSEATGRVYIPDPALNDYPEGTTYIYRAANMLTPLSAATRMNTNILVYTDKAFADKDEAKAYLDSLGLIAMADVAYGSIVLVTPINPEAGFGAADQYAYFLLQAAMCNMGRSVRVDNVANYFTENAYYGGVSYRYLLGVDGGATFVNNFISSTFDYVTRLAGIILVNGEMERIRNVAAPVPVYLLNPTEMTVEKYKAANHTDMKGYIDDIDFYYNQALPLQKVVVDNSSTLDADLILNVSNDFLIKAMRIPITRNAVNSASTLFRDYNFNSAPYSLTERNPLIGDGTPDGIYVIEHQEDRFKDIATEAGLYLDTWYEILPAEVLDGTAPDGSVPFILLNHGGGDDPVQFVEQNGWLALAGNERVAMVAGYHSGLTSVAPIALPALAQYMLDTYPALDASRVYVSGYSMGGGATVNSVYGNPSLFAAAVPMGAVSVWPTEEQAAVFDEVDIPVLFTTSTLDYYVIYDRELTDAVGLTGMGNTNNPNADLKGLINQFLGFNEMPQIDYDFDTYQYLGAKADYYVEKMLNGEYLTRIWLINNADGVPMLGLSMTDFLVHGLYPEYAKLAWDFMKHYTRDQETGEIIYNPYAK